MTRLVLAVAALLGLSARGEQVRFIAPAPLRDAVKSALEEKKIEAIDDSLLDDALFTDPSKAADALAKGTFPPELSSDFLAGAKACAERPKSKSSSLERCQRQLVRAVWQRHLNRTQPARVLELRPPVETSDGWMLECATYAPADHWVLAANVLGETPADAAKKAVTRLLIDKRGEKGTRPNSSVLPTRATPKDPSLAVGRAQLLPGFQVSDCALRPLDVTPRDAPLAQSLRNAWNASGVSSKAPQLKCRFELSGEPGRAPETLTLNCGTFLSALPVFEGGPDFADDAFQAELVRAFGAELIRETCR